MKLLMAAVPLCAATLFAAPAHAEPSTQVMNYAADAAPAICSTLADYPTLPGVAGVLDGIQHDSGFTSYESGEVLALAVMADCPRFVPLIKRFADTFAGPQTGANV